MKRIKKFPNLVSRNALVLALLFVGLVFAACEKELNRVVKKAHKNGNPATVYYYSGEQKQEFLQKVELFYPSGKIKTLKRYEDGKLEGYSESWYEDGTPWSRIDYKDNKMVGDYFNNYASGKPKYVGKYTDGKKDGTWVKYNKEGDTSKLEFYEKGKFIRLEVFDKEKKQQDENQQEKK